ncbi:hypothetical protein ABZT16_41110 [Streptomyces flaveolus]|uniref:hypothetical protein n=1 Tax=Streptomyces flaveolus TaxID=67297 RepID=UPI000B27B3FC|nr:hypothetical protein [Streptomyces antibioticus]
MDLLRGYGRLTGEKQVAVGTRERDTFPLTARTPSSSPPAPALPDLPGLDSVRP